MSKATKWRRRLVSGLAWFMAAELLFFAPLKFISSGAFGYPPYSEKFVNWGYPAWFRFVVGAAEVLAALMLMFPRRRFIGAAIMLFVLTGAVATHIINHDSFVDSFAAPVHWVFSAIIALAYWPVDWRDPIALGGDRTAPVPSGTQRS